MCFSCCRMFFVGARDRQLPNVLAMIDIKRKTPMPSLLVVVCQQITSSKPFQSNQISLQIAGNDFSSSNFALDWKVLNTLNDNIEQQSVIYEQQLRHFAEHFALRRKSFTGLSIYEHKFCRFFNNTNSFNNTKPKCLVLYLVQAILSWTHCKWYNVMQLELVLMIEYIQDLHVYSWPKHVELLKQKKLILLQRK